MSVFTNIIKAVLPGVGGLAVDVVENVIKGVTKKDDMDEAMEVLKTDPAAMAQVQEQLSEERVAIEVEQTKQQAEVNATMRAELVGGSKFQKGWRPLNGYLFGLTLFLNYGLIPIVNVFKTQHLAIANIPEFVFVSWAAVVGVTVHSRGKEKLAKIGINGPGIIDSLLAGIKKK